MKDLSEYVSTLLNLGCVNGSEIKYDGHIIPMKSIRRIVIVCDYKFSIFDLLFSLNALKRIIYVFLL